jgi:glycosyltransferase involved in cell wall biosynthesis
LVKLIDWLKHDYKPEIVQLTNSLFVGMARTIKKELSVPVLCAMQGEDIFLEELIEPYKTRALEVLRERAQEVDGFIATSDYYADFMAAYIRVPRKKIHVVKLGINLQGHGKARARTGDHNPFIIGYLARICPEKGLHMLVDAVSRLTKLVKPDAIKLKVAGYLGPRDRRYFDEIKNKVDSAGLHSVFEYAGEINRQQKIEFINSLDVLSVPTTYKEPKGLYVLEALANGVPVVQPRHGAFPEMIAATGGGILVDPDSSEALAKGIYDLMKHAEQRKKLGENGRAIVHKNFSDEAMAEATQHVYQQYL